MKTIKLSDGAGGESMQNFLRKNILKHLTEATPDYVLDPLTRMDDSGVRDGIVLTTDGHTVKPLFYPGGDIGRLSICGTINDIAVMGAKPIALSLAMIIEEGFENSKLDVIMQSMDKACKEAGVPVITGDTKVVEHGAVEEVFITTSGVGRTWDVLEENNEYMKTLGRPQEWLLDSNVRDGDIIISSGTLGDHGIALLSHREGYGFESDIKSDNAPLNRMMAKILGVGGIAAAKDPTRGGIANTLNEWASKSNIGISIDQESLPISSAVKHASELLGIDLLQVGNEGKVILAVHPSKAEEVLEIIRKERYGKDAEIIGVADKAIQGVVMTTVIGGRRVIEPPIADPVPRIC